MNQYDMKGRVAVITGGAQGFGLAIARRLAASGAKVALWDMDKAELANAKATLRGALTVVVDQTNYKAVEKARDATLKRFGRIDILVNNAGIAGQSAPVVDFPLEEWKKIIDIDLHGVFHCCKAVVPGMIAQNYGRIVNISSVAGKEGNPNAAAYSAAKAGVLALTKSLGKELATHNIAVNALTPSPANTRILAQVSEAHIKYMLSRVPRARFVEVDEAAAMVAFMASEENSFTTGATFDLSGGRTTY